MSTNIIIIPDSTPLINDPLETSASKYNNIWLRAPAATRLPAAVTVHRVPRPAAAPSVTDRTGPPVFGTRSEERGPAKTIPIHWVFGCVLTDCSPYNRPNRRSVREIAPQPRSFFIVNIKHIKMERTSINPADIRKKKKKMIIFRYQCDMITRSETIFTHSTHRQASGMPHCQPM